MGWKGGKGGRVEGREGGGGGEGGGGETLVGVGAWGKEVGVGRWWGPGKMGRSLCLVGGRAKRGSEQAGGGEGQREVGEMVLREWKELTNARRVSGEGGLGEVKRGC